MDGYPQWDTIFEFDYLISLVRSVRCFLFSLLSMRVLLASAANWFGYVAVLSLYFSACLSISSLTVSIFKSLSISSFLTYHVALTIVPSIFDCSDSSLFMWLIAVVPHSAIPYVQIGFIVLWIFSLFSVLSLEFRVVSQYICLLFIRILSIIDLVCCFHVSCVSKYSLRYLTCLVRSIKCRN